MANECPEAPGEARKRINDGLVQGHGGFDAVTQLGCHPLVRVDHQDPVAHHQRLGALPLHAEALPVVLNHDLVGKCPGDITRGIGTAGIHHHDLVHPAQRLQAGAQMRFLVLDDQYGSQAHRPFLVS
ncbi:hypothetical protein Q427_06570 [Halomonas sp. BC04]|nr:hypothetical protein Q427_06570 [Halomonas sp. BC04]